MTPTPAPTQRATRWKIPSPLTPTPYPLNSKRVTENHKSSPLNPKHQTRKISARSRFASTVSCKRTPRHSATLAISIPTSGMFLDINMRNAKTDPSPLNLTFDSFQERCRPRGHHGAWLPWGFRSQSQVRSLPPTSSPFPFQPHPLTPTPCPLNSGNHKTSLLHP